MPYSRPSARRPVPPPKLRDREEKKKMNHTIPSNVRVGMFLWIKYEDGYSNAVVREVYDDCFVAKAEHGGLFRHEFKEVYNNKVQITFATVDGDYVIAKRGLFGFKAKPSKKTVKDEPNA